MAVLSYRVYRYFVYSCRLHNEILRFSRNPLGNLCVFVPFLYLCVHRTSWHTQNIIVCTEHHSVHGTSYCANRTSHGVHTEVRPSKCARNIMVREQKITWCAHRSQTIIVCTERARTEHHMVCTQKSEPLIRHCTL